MARTGGASALFGPPRFMDSEIPPRHADIATALQEATNADRIDCRARKDRARRDWRGHSRQVN
jgi:hypothetical protein